ncbi:acetyl-CoA carboxylase biotin carboxyl carrier protein subunit [Oceanicoccus sp. KOV_DT_Chl]|uniref:acetyl-CoA carboxylase biotin carboxyl carrier protein subunit n=1 Tax=Oceanicoccus sp. KOV_DT_Chl TaxID=1904639 RepID=UPI001359906B|nr:acetyl-CoA carboxylase biotin carboxyl carrier protein subunit [Oceanicoccus sp. KOV_DT_Chl]
MQPKYILNGVTHTAAPVRVADEITLNIDSHLVSVRIEKLGLHHYELFLNGVHYPCYVAQDGENIFIHMHGKSWSLELASEFSSAGSGENVGGGVVRAPMPGVVVDVYVANGDQVVEGQSLMLIESMKLQTEVKAAISGIVDQVNVESGNTFEKSSVLALIAVAEGELA